MTDDRLLLKRTNLALTLAVSYLTEIAALGQAYPRCASIHPSWHVRAKVILVDLRRLAVEIESSLLKDAATKKGGER